MIPGGFALPRTPPFKKENNSKPQIYENMKFPWSNESNIPNKNNFFNIHEEEIQKKKQQQEFLANMLKKQIEEKKKSNYQDPSKKRPTFESVSKEADQILDRLILKNNKEKELISNSIFLENPLQNKPIYGPKLIQLNNFANLREKVQIPIHNNQIEVFTDSPFDSIKVSTPPLGFSLRKTIPIKELVSAPPEIKENKYHPPKTKFGRNFPKKNNNNFNEKKKTFVTDDLDDFTNKDIWSMPRLGTNSELVYPDGHISGLSSPR